MSFWSVKIFWTAAMVALVCLLTAAQAGAFDQDDLNRLLETKTCTRCDLAGAELTGAQLRRADLRLSNLSGADLSRANLRESVLSKANLSGADLRQANLSSTDLSEVNFYGADLREADLTDAELLGATWVDGRKCGVPSLGECN